MRKDRSLVRSGQWWDHKIPPLIAAAVLAVLPATDPNGLQLFVDLILFLITAVGVAAFGHVVNDLADIKTDAIAGAPNQMAALSTQTRTAVLGGTVVCGLLPWIWLPHTTAALSLLGIEVLLLLIYSLKPIRLKDRAAAGVLADSLYAYVVPVLLSIAVFTQVGGISGPGWAITLTVGIWALLMGLRGILWHQVGDIAHDQRAGLSTLATKIGVTHSRRILGVMVIIEFAAAALALIVVAQGTGESWLPVFGLGYVLYRIFQMSVLWSEPVHLRSLRHSGGRIRFLGFVLLNEFVEKWLPLAALIAIALRLPLMWFAVLLYLVLFDNAAVEFLRRDLAALPDAMNRIAHERKSRANIRQVAAARKALVAAGPASVTAEIQNRCRWVFVVCGPEMHTETLRTAVRHLGPLTSLEIWVITDSTRNVRPVDVEGIHTVIDVATPDHFDDHQASIWLKTGIHRHLPVGEWCYLDTDIIAVRPGVEEIFEHRKGPVAFASDLTISVNQVDRFSPWAMNCECTGHGDTHSCSHLREQISERFGIEVPGDWVHWNGGVFLFGPDSAEFLDMWNARAIASFDWPEWRTRDQGALIATAWTLSQQDCPRLPAEFNFIADLGNGDLCLDPELGWALHPAGPWHQARLMHLYTSRLEDPEWELGRDVEAPVIRQTLVRTNRWRRFELRQKARDGAVQGRQKLGYAMVDAYWWAEGWLGLIWLKIRRQPQRLKLSRLRASFGRRLGTKEHSA
ncbi:4-hydroxybenzoate polyprenyltransferase-like prenyltransferase [Actinobacteria bacterium IMCC26207]|nr:4-hydroxybenzoate polyprenyltransferase-like prenyltransferase [Actinobacteria bacterium IMCC26207]